MHHNHAAGLSGVWPILAVGGVLVVAVLVGVVLYRRLRQPDGLSPHERRHLGPLEAEVLALVRQRGGPVSQPDIAAESGADTELVGRVLQDLQARGLVRRDWSHEDECYIVSLPQS